MLTLVLIVPWPGSVSAQSSLADIADQGGPGFVHAVSFSVMNNESQSVSSPFQLLVTVNSSYYSAYEAANLQNVEFTYTNGTVVPSWIQVGNSNSSTYTSYWLKIVGGIPARSSIALDMDFAAPSVNLFNNSTVGEAPTLSARYGQFDDGRSVFSLYDNFAGNTLDSTLWTVGANTTVATSDGVTVSFSGAGGLLSKARFMPGTIFEADVTSIGDVNEVGFFNSTIPLPSGDGAFQGAFIRTACGVTYPDQWNGNGEANGCGGPYGALANTEGVPGIYEVYPLTESGSLSYLNSGVGNSHQPVTTDAPSYPCSVGFSGGQHSLGASWVRVRVAPPGGIMPTVVGLRLGRLYNLTFQETGLASGTSWSVQLGVHSNQSTTDTISFGPIPGGSYEYSIPSVYDYTTSNLTETIFVDRPHIYVPIDFVKLPLGNLTLHVQPQNATVMVNLQTVPSPHGIATLTDVPYGTYNVYAYSPFYQYLAQGIALDMSSEIVNLTLAGSPGINGASYPWVPIGPYGYANPQYGGVGPLVTAVQSASGHIGPAMAIDAQNPDTIFIESGMDTNNQGPYGDGGVFRTYDGGTTWQPVDFGLPSDVVGSLLMNQGTPAELLVSMWDNGIYRTDDSGGYWYQVANITEVVGLVEMNGTVYAGSSSGVIASSDFGASWKVVYASSSGVFALAASQGYLYAVTGSLDLIRSTDLGATWRVVNDLSRNPLNVWSVSVSPFDPNELYLGGIGPPYALLSYDGGSSFNQTSFYAKAVVFDPLNASRIWAFSSAYEAYSVDGGAHFIQGPQGTDNQGLVVDPSNDSILALGSDQGVYESNDHGVSWFSINGNLNDSLLSGLAVSSNQKHIIADVQDYSGFLSLNGGRTWIYGNIGNSSLNWGTGEDSATYINPGNDSWVYAYSPGGGSFWISSNGGVSYAPGPSAIRGPGVNGANGIDTSTNSIIATNPSDPAQVFVGAATGIYLSEDFGNTWGLWGGSPANVTALDVVTSSLVYAGTVGGLWRYNGTWTKSSGVTGGDVASVSVSPSDPQDVIATTGLSYDFGQFFVSTDGGQSFSLRPTNLPMCSTQLCPYDSAYLRATFLNVPGNPILALTNFGVYLSTNLGRSWSDISYNLLSGEVTDATLIGNNLYLSTYGQGIVVYRNFSLQNLSGEILGNFSEVAGLNVSLDGTSVATFVGHFQSFVSPGEHSLNITWIGGSEEYNLTVAAMQTIFLNYTPKHTQNYTVTFTESGLVASASWSVTLNGTAVGSTTSTITFTEPNGTYGYTVSVVSGYTSSPSSGSVTVVGQGQAVAVTFTAVAPSTYFVTFTEGGLPSGMSWSVTLNGAMLDSTSSAIAFTEPNGTYDYTIGAVPGWTMSQYSGSVTVTGAAANVSVAWTPVTYSVMFSETGLPSGTAWSVTLGGSRLSSTTGTITFTEPNGTYAYTIADVPGWHQTTLPYTGSVTVNGASVREPTVAFTQVTYTVTFNATGRPSGTSWQVWLNSTLLPGLGYPGGPDYHQGGTSSSLTISAVNGSYSFAVGSVSGYTASPSSGSLTVNGADVSQAISFASVSVATYAVTFTESGLPTATSWSVTLGGVIHTSTTGVIRFTEPNETYTYGANPDGAYYAQSGGNGTFTINGAAQSFSVTYAWTVTLTFSQTGLPSGSRWTVNVIAADPASWQITSSSSTITFHLPANASYSYTITVPSGQSVSTSSGSATLGASGQTVPTVSISPSSASSSSFPWTYVIVGVVIAAIVVGIAFGLMRRKPPAPPPPT
jgi:hypothetical protein